MILTAQRRSLLEYLAVAEGPVNPHEIACSGYAYRAVMAQLAYLAREGYVARCGHLVVITPTGLLAITPQLQRYRSDAEYARSGELPVPMGDAGGAE